jgi:hypothetical protein
MNTIILSDDIEVFYVTASSFPEGIQAAFDELESKVSTLEGRTRYGISRPENGGAIVYKAGVAAKVPGEGKKYGCATMIIPKGQYLSIGISDFQNHLEDIGCAFKDILAEPQIDPNGYCVEEYYSDNDMRCMVRIDPAKLK